MSTVSFDDAFTALALLETSIADVEVLSAVPNEMYDQADTLIDSMDVSFSLNGLPGVFTVTVPYDALWAAIAVSKIYYKSLILRAIFAGASSSAQADQTYLDNLVTIVNDQLATYAASIPV